jgi:hypothetical protein
VAQAWRDHGRDYAVELLCRIGHGENGLRIWFVLLDAQPGETSGEESEERARIPRWATPARDVKPA